MKDLNQQHLKELRRLLTNRHKQQQIQIFSWSKSLYEIIPPSPRVPEYEINTTSIQQQQ